MRVLHRTLLAAVLAGVACTASAEPPRPLRSDHPMLGNWRFTLPGGQCTETYLIRGNGTTIVTSGDEVAESEIDVSDRPDEHGFYHWVDRIVRDNGKMDCSGTTMKLGDVSSIFARLDTTGERMLVCFDTEMKQCFGPLQRVYPISAIGR